MKNQTEVTQETKQFYTSQELVDAFESLHSATGFFADMVQKNQSTAKGRQAIAEACHTIWMRDGKTSQKRVRSLQQAVRRATGGKCSLRQTDKETGTYEASIKRARKSSDTGNGNTKPVDFAAAKTTVVEVLQGRPENEKIATISQMAIALGLDGQVLARNMEEIRKAASK